MRRARALGATALLPILLAGGARAQDGDAPRVEVQVDRPRPPANVPVHVSFTFSGTGSLGDVRPPDSFPLRNLSPAGGPSSSTRITFINGELSKSVTLTYRFLPKGAGPAELGETTWSVGGKTVKAAGYVFEVGPPAADPGPGPGLRDEDPFAEPGMGFPPGSADRRDRRVGATRRSEPLVLYTVTPDRTTAYVGEEILLHYELVTQADVTGLEYAEPPKFPGFWAEDIERPERPTGRRATHEGQTVLRFTLMKKAVAGLAPGSLTVPPSTIRLAVRGGGDFFDDPFGFMRPRVVERSTAPLLIKVLPIPGRPDFKGPVGSFDLSASLDHRQVAAGEALTLKVKLAGTGNLRTATEAPRIEIPGARVYAPTSKSGSGRAAGRLTSTAEWSYVVVPQAEGELTVPPVALDVFDPEQKRIVTRTTAPLTVRVTPGAPEPALASGATPPSSAPSAPAEAGAPATPASGEALTLPPSEPPVTSAKGGAASPTPEPGAPTLDLTRRTVAIPVWLLVAVPVALVAAGGAAALAVRSRRRSREWGAALVPEDGETKERAAARVDRALRDRLLRRHGVPEGAPTGTILERLEASGLPSDLRDDVRELLADLDFLRFAPQLGEYEERIAETRERARRVLSRLG